MTNLRPMSKNDRQAYRQWKLSIGKHVWETRRKRRWTLAKCEKKSGVSRKVIERVELGEDRFNLPDFFYLLQALGLAKKLGSRICENDEDTSLRASTASEAIGPK